MIYTLQLGGSVMSNRGKTIISCTLYRNNILCVRVD